MRRGRCTHGGMEGVSTEAKEWGGGEACLLMHGGMWSVSPDAWGHVGRVT